MIKRTSLVWKRSGLSDAEFKELWLGEHATAAKNLPGVRQYVIDFIADAPAGLPSGIAVLRFDDHASLERAFADPELKRRLLETRAQFASRAEVFIVEEAIVLDEIEGIGH